MDARVIDPSRCFECGAPATYEHHVVPQVRGGTKTVPLCARCHGPAHCNTDLFTLSREGRLRVREEGRRHAGRPPYGWVMDRDGYLVEARAERRVIEVVRQMTEDGWSCNGISRYLNHWRVPAKSGRQWSSKTVWRVVERLKSGPPGGVRPDAPPPPPPPALPKRPSDLPGQKTLPIFEALD